MIFAAFSSFSQTKNIEFGSTLKKHWHDPISVLQFWWNETKGWSLLPWMLYWHYWFWLRCWLACWYDLWLRSRLSALKVTHCLASIAKPADGLSWTLQRRMGFPHHGWTSSCKACCQTSRRQAFLYTWINFMRQWSRSNSEGGSFMQCTGAKILMECLVEQGVDTIFGYHRR